MRLIPRNTAFFDDFDKHTALLIKAAETLSSMVSGQGSPASDLAQKIKLIEEEADDIVHRVVVELRKTFITPLDRDDTHRLITRLDDVLDQIEAVAYRLALYRLPLPNRHLTSLVELVRRSAVVTCDAVANLREADTRDHALELCVEINKLENEADSALRLALADLFSDGADPVALIKWKEIFETLEDTTDRCEDVANAIENLLLDS